MEMLCSPSEVQAESLFGWSQMLNEDYDDVGERWIQVLRVSRRPRTARPCATMKRIMTTTTTTSSIVGFFGVVR